MNMNKLSRDFNFFKNKIFFIRNVMFPEVLFLSVRFTYSQKRLSIIFYRQGIWKFIFLVIKICDLKFIQIDVFILTIIFNWDLFIISFLSSLEIGGLWFRLSNFIFCGACWSRTLTSLVSKLHSIENF